MKYKIYLYNMLTIIIYSNASLEESFAVKAIEHNEQYCNPLLQKYNAEYADKKNKIRDKALQDYQSNLRGLLGSRKGIISLNIIYFILICSLVTCFIFNGIVNEGIIYFQTLWAFLTNEIINMILYVITMTKSQINHEITSEEKWRFRLTQFFLFFLNLPAFMFTLITLLNNVSEVSILNDCLTYTGSDVCNSSLSIGIMMLYFSLLLMCIVKLCL